MAQVFSALMPPYFMVILESTALLRKARVVNQFKDPAKRL
jgi:hypothetical protein